MAETSAAGMTSFKLGMWVDRILAQVQEMVKSKDDPQAQSSRYYRFYHEDIDPVLNILMTDPSRAEAAAHLRALRDALESHFLNLPASPEQAKKNYSAIFRAGMALRNELKPEMEEAPRAEARLHDLPWRTYMDEEGHVVFDGGAGLRVPISGDISSLAKAEIIAQAIRQQPVYPDDVRPRNALNKPGGLLKIEDAKRMIVVGDLHGRYDNLELILADKDNWAAIKEGRAHLLFLGDVIHPSTSKGDLEALNYDSFRVLLLVLSLRAENPGTVHYILGNHENAHVGGPATAKGTADVGTGFEGFIVKRFGEVILHSYEDFLRDCVVAVKVRMRNIHTLAVHASLSPLVKSEQGLVNLLVKGRRGKALTEMLWGRIFEPKALLQSLVAVGCKYAIGGHTRPTKDAAKKHGFTCMLEPAFGHVHGRLLIVTSQNNTFGYLDIDLDNPPSQSVEDFKSPDGKYAFRVIKRSG